MHSEKADATPDKMCKLCHLRIIYWKISGIIYLIYSKTPGNHLLTVAR